MLIIFVIIIFIFFCQLDLSCNMDSLTSQLLSDLRHHVTDNKKLIMMLKELKYER